MSLRPLQFMLKNDGILYILDVPDIAKVYRLPYSRIQCMLVRIFLVYQIKMAGIFVCDDLLKTAALAAGFDSVQKDDSWCKYRSHYALLKIQPPKSC